MAHTAFAAQEFGGSKRIIDREDDYRRRRLNRALSPARNDAFAMVRSDLSFFLSFALSLTAFSPSQGDKTPDPNMRTYAEVMKETQLAREREVTLRQIAEKNQQSSEEQVAAARAQQLDMSRPTGASGAAAVPVAPPAIPAADGAVGTKRRSRWDQSTDVKCAPANPRAPRLATRFV